MSDQKSGSQPAAAAAPAQTEKKPSLAEQVRALDQEVQQLEKRLSQFSPDLVNQLKTRQQELEEGLKILNEINSRMSAVFCSPLRESDLALEIQALKESAVAFFTQMKVNPDQWKNIAS
jgi:hypothetical protein